MALSDAFPFGSVAYACDEASGSLLDQVGLLDLTEHGTVDSATGKIANARDFEASDNMDWFSRADDVAFSTGDVDFMIRCWVKFESFAGTMTVVCKGQNLADDAATEYALYANASSEIHFRVAKSGNGFGDVAWSATLLTGTWYLVHGWHDSTNNQIGIAVDAGTAVTSSWSVGVNDTATAFVVGNDDATGVSRLMDGLIDDIVLLKNYILDATERTEDYNSGAGVAYADWAAAPPAAGQIVVPGNLFAVAS